MRAKEVTDMWKTRMGYSVVRVKGHGLGRFDTLAAAEAFADEQPFDTEILPFIEEELV